MVVGKAALKSISLKTQTEMRQKRSSRRVYALPAVSSVQVASRVSA